MNRACFLAGENKGVLKERKQRAISSTDIFMINRKDEKVKQLSANMVYNKFYLGILPSLYSSN